MRKTSSSNILAKKINAILVGGTMAISGKIAEVHDEHAILECEARLGYGGTKVAVFYDKVSAVALS